MTWFAKYDARPHVRLYIDEIRTARNAAGERWSYIGVLAVPVLRHSDVLACLQEDRDRAGYAGEVHFRDLKNRSDATIHNEKALLARHWAERVVHDDHKAFHFHLFGINRDALNLDAFGAGWQQERNVYNRFFRAALLGALEYFFGSRGIVVIHVFHDTTAYEHDEAFYTHAIETISRTHAQIHFVRSGISFIDSDHRVEERHPEQSHLMQLCDVLLGGFALCLDARTSKAGCREVAEVLLPVAERLTDPRRHRNPNSQYRYHRRLSLGFFPSGPLAPMGLDAQEGRRPSALFINRPLLLKQHGAA